MTSKMLRHYQSTGPHFVENLKRILFQTCTVNLSQILLLDIG